MRERPAAATLELRGQEPPVSPFKLQKVLENSASGFAHRQDALLANPGERVLSCIMIDLTQQISRE